MKTWFMYVLRVSDGALYAGVTTDLVRRLAEHRNGEGSKYVRSRLPCTMVAAVPFADKRQALRQEYRFKQLTRREKLNAITRFPAIYGSIVTELPE